MFCTNCGAQITGGRFCPNCGSPLSGQPQAAAQPVRTASEAVNLNTNSNSAVSMNSNTVYVAPVYPQLAPAVNVNVDVRKNAPEIQLRTNRGLWKTILLSIITFGIYGLVMMCNISTDINTVATRYDKKRTMHYALLIFIVAPLTLGIAAIVWQHKLCSRMGAELQRRGVSYSFGASDFWLWGVLGCLILVGPFVFTHKFLKAMNLLCADYNVNG